MSRTDRWQGLAQLPLEGLVLGALLLGYRPLTPLAALLAACFLLPLRAAPQLQQALLAAWKPRPALFPNLPVLPPFPCAFTALLLLAASVAAPAWALLFPLWLRLSRRGYQPCFGLAWPAQLGIAACCFLAALRGQVLGLAGFAGTSGTSGLLWQLGGLALWHGLPACGYVSYLISRAPGQRASGA